MRGLKVVKARCFCVKICFDISILETPGGQYHRPVEGQTLDVLLFDHHKYSKIDGLSD